MLVEAHSRGKGKVRTQADEHTAPAGIVEVEVVLDDPALTHLQMPMIILLVAIGNEYPSGLAGSENGDDLVRLGLFEIRVDEIIAAPIGRFQHWDVPFL